MEVTTSPKQPGGAPIQKRLSAREKHKAAREAMKKLSDAFSSGGERSASGRDPVTNPLHRPSKTHDGEAGHEAPNASARGAANHPAETRAGLTHRSEGGHFIASAIKRPGALTRAIGGKPSKKMKKVRRLAKTGTPLQRREAGFYLNVLSKTHR